MEGLIAAMKSPRPGPREDSADPADDATEAPTQAPSDEDDPLAAAPWREVGLASLEPGERVLERGATIGRHVVLAELGAGGMGVVYAAYDPELDRKVALKLLRPGTVGDNARTRLLREAQALAKLSHPNVVAIHDVGTVGERVWVAMEFVQGRTLRRWLEAPRSWREVVEIMRPAGEGLAAAHAAGLLHRDFKPDNVMVGDDGRVRVMDFGLARARPSIEPPEADESQATPMLDTFALDITRAGALLGTPRYMSPEQFGSAEVTAAADQFAFCVTLWEALYGERPFGGDSPMALAANVLGGRLRAPPKGRSLPTRLRRACERGLLVEPSRRWPSMEALLEELRKLAGPTRRRAVLGLALAGGMVAVGVGLQQYAEVGFRCDGALAQLQGIWDEGRRQAVRDAILGTELSYAADTWERVEPRLDEYAAAWAEKHTEVCEATSVRQEQSAEVMDLRMECLRGRRVELREVVNVLTKADPTRVEKAVQVVASLPGLSRCDEVEALRAELPPPEDPAVREQVQLLRERLVQARTLTWAGAYTEALQQAGAVVEQAERLGYAPLLAEALLDRGRGQEGVARYAEAEQDQERAYLLALEHGHHGVATKAAELLVHIVGVRLTRFEPALELGKTALALAKRRGLEPELEGFTLISIGLVLVDQGKPEEALFHFQRALPIVEEALGPRHRAVAASLNNIGKALWAQGKLEDALTYYQRALIIKEEALGPRHPDVGHSLHNIGDVLRSQGKLDEALLHQRSALAIFEQALGPRHPSVALALHGLGIMLKARNELDEALAHYQRALSIWEALDPRDHHIAGSLVSIGNVLQSQGKLDEALVHHQRALIIMEETLGPRHPSVAVSLSNIGLVLVEQGKLDEALLHYRRALAIKEEASGPHHPSIAFTLMGLAELSLAKHDPKAAREHAERAVSIREAGETSPDLVASARFVLAQALWSEGSERPRARALAEQARAAYADFGDARAKERADIEVWLAAHKSER